MNGPLVGKVCVKFELDTRSLEPPTSQSLALAREFQQAIYSLNGMYVGSKCSHKCYHLNVSLVDYMCVEFRLDPEPFGPLASHSLVLASKFQQACKLGNDAFHLHIQMGRFGKHDKPIMGLKDVKCEISFIYFKYHKGT